MPHRPHNTLLTPTTAANQRVLRHSMTTHQPPIFKTTMVHHKASTTTKHSSPGKQLINNRALLFGLLVVLFTLCAYAPSAWADPVVLEEEEEEEEPVGCQRTFAVEFSSQTNALPTNGTIILRSTSVGECPPVNNDAVLTIAIGTQDGVPADFETLWLEDASLLEATAVISPTHLEPGVEHTFSACHTQPEALEPTCVVENFVTTEAADTLLSEDEHRFNIEYTDTFMRGKEISAESQSYIMRFRASFIFEHLSDDVAAYQLTLDTSEQVRALFAQDIERGFTFTLKPGTVAFEELDALANQEVCLSVTPLLIDATLGNPQQECFTPRIIELEGRPPGASFDNGPEADEVGCSVSKGHRGPSEGHTALWALLALGALIVRRRSGR